MKVNRNLTTHPKFIAFKRELGDAAALEYLIRLWGHCEEQQRGEDWGKATAEYVELICGWTGEHGKLFDAFSHPFCGKPGWIRIMSGGRVIVNGWEEQNSGLVANWFRNPGGKKKNGAPDRQPTDTPRGHHGEPPDNPIRSDKSGVKKSGSTRARGGADAGIPALEEVTNHGATKDIPADYCAHYHSTKRIKKSWHTKNSGLLVDWQLELETWWAKDRHTWSSTKNGAGNEKDLIQLQAELGPETDPQKRRALQEQIKKLGAS